jgi:hypothetical protein
MGLKFYWFFSEWSEIRFYLLVLVDWYLDSPIRKSFGTDQIRIRIHTTLVSGGGTDCRAARRACATSGLLWHAPPPGLDLEFFAETNLT